MGTKEIIKEFIKLPVQKRIYVIEKTIQSIRKQEDTNQMKEAVSKLYEDYTTDRELTLFTDIDFEDFYETR